jgi:hypothetical protein
VNELSKRNEACDLIRMQLDVEKKRAADESARGRKQLAEASERVASLQRDVEEMRGELDERAVQVAQLNSTRANLEAALRRERDESETSRRGLEAELATLKEQHVSPLADLDFNADSLLSSCCSSCSLSCG